MDMNKIPINMIHLFNLQQIQTAQTQQVQGAKITAHIPTGTAGQQQQVILFSMILDIIIAVAI